MRSPLTAGLIAASVVLGGCTYADGTPNPTANFALGGAATGAALGSLAGDGSGALIGGLLGAGAGAVIGGRRQRQQAPSPYDFPG